MHKARLVLFTVGLLLVLIVTVANGFYYRPPGAGDPSTWKSTEWKQRCPKVKAMRNFDLTSMMGFWYVMQYYASSEEVSEYSCMRSLFSMNDEYVTMNFTYIFEDDPNKDQLQGNITWTVPDYQMPSHWMHTEDIYEGVYNTYVLDTDSSTWALIMHCAEKSKTPRYLSALLLSREKSLGVNVVNFLREKLPRYDIDLSQLFPINQDTCDGNNQQTTISAAMEAAEDRFEVPPAELPNTEFY